MNIVTGEWSEPYNFVISGEVVNPEDPEDPDDPSGQFQESSILIASDYQEIAEFGNSVAISKDGTRCIIGAVYHDYTPVPTGPTSNQGQAYVFVRSGNSWIQEAILKAPDVKGWCFGEFVAIDQNGTRVVVGAPQSSGGGQVYIFCRNDVTWAIEKILSVTGGVSFGRAIAITDDGSRLIIGDYGSSSSPYSNNGKAYTYLRSGTNWVQESILTPYLNGSEKGYFGFSVDINSSGDVAVISSYEGIGVGRLTVYTRLGNTWTRKAEHYPTDGGTTYGTGYGNKVAINDIGNRIAVAYHGYRPNGTVIGKFFILKFENDSLSVEASFTGEDVGIEDGANFAFSLAMSKDGKTIAVGDRFASNNSLKRAGKLHLFELIGNTWEYKVGISPTDGKDHDFFSTAMDFDFSGNWLLSCSYMADLYGLREVGKVYAFSRN